MATKRKIYLPCNLATAAGVTTLVDLPLYYDYHSIGFEYVDTAAAGSVYTGGGAGGLLADIAFKINADVSASIPRRNWAGSTVSTARCSPVNRWSLAQLPAASSCP